MKKMLISLICLIAIVTGSYAQRLLPGQRGWQFSIGVPIIKNELFEKGNINIETAMTINHKQAGYWLFGLEYTKKNFEYRSVQIPAETFTFEGGYILNLLADAGRNILVNGGLTAVVGYETVNQDNKLLFDGATLLEQDRFLYGCAPHLVIDLYITDNLVLFTKGKCNILWNSDVEMFRPQISAGIRLIF